MRRALLALAFVVPLAAQPAHAHGLWGHVHVTGWAVENLPPGELRSFLLDEPEVFNALLFGAVFADTGYALDDPAARAYSEHAHWEPFVEDFATWVRANDPPPWNDLASRKRVAFLLGCASHGLQDALFDSLFLHQVESHDGVGQDETDPGTDGFLALDGHLRFTPEREIPLETVLELFEALPEDVTEQVIDDAVSLVTAVYINDTVGPLVAAQLGLQALEVMPWGYAHYLDPDVPGSLRAEILPTAAYQQALWDRLHGRPVVDPTAVFPEPERRLRSGEVGAPDSWVTVGFGQGVAVGSVDLVLEDDAGGRVGASVVGNRWGSDPSRVVRLQPTEPLVPGAFYTARLAAGAEGIDGTALAAWHHTFQVACAADDDPACPPLAPAVASIDGPVAPTTPTASIPTGATADTGADATSPTEAPAPVDEAAGCGCDGGAGSGGLWGLAVLLGWRRRSA